MENKLLDILFFVATLFTFNVVKYPSHHELEVKDFVQESSEEFYTLFANITRNLNVPYSRDSELKAPMFQIQDAGEAMVRIAKKAKTFESFDFYDKELKRILRLIYLLPREYFLGPSGHFKIFLTYRPILLLGHSKRLKHYREKKETRWISYYPEAYNIIANSTDPEELKYYWIEVRQKHKGRTGVNMGIVLNGTREAAIKMGVDPEEYWLRNYQVEDMDRLMDEIKPLYLELHAFIRYKLNQKYGNDVLKLDEPIPDHLFQQVLAQAWTNDSIIDDVYPFKDLPTYNSQNPMTMYKTADKFYESLGFQSLDANMWGNRIKLRDDSDKSDCKADIFINSPEVYLRFCRRTNIRTQFQAFGNMAHLYYNAEKKDLPAYYVDAYDLEYAVGEAVILSASTPTHLKESAIYSRVYTDHMSKNRHMRMAIHTLLNIPLYFVHTKVLAEFYAGKLEIEDMNIRYWELMDEYVGVKPPIDRVSNDTYDFPFKFYINIPEHRQAQKFHSEILGYQLYKKLCQISKEYKYGSLHNCNFYNNKDAGDALKRVMKLGSSKPFHEVMAQMFPKDDVVMSAESLLEYYEPIKIWLMEKNKDAKVNLGWKPSDKKTVRIRTFSENEPYSY